MIRRGSAPTLAELVDAAIVVAIGLLSFAVGMLAAYGVPHG